jgi:hypothetical protein
VFLSIHACGCARPVAFYCWILSAKLLTGPRKSRSVGNLLIETQRALKIAGCHAAVPRG